MSPAGLSCRPSCCSGSDPGVILIIPLLVVLVMLLLVVLLGLVVLLVAMRLLEDSARAPPWCALFPTSPNFRGPSRWRPTARGSLLWPTRSSPV